MTHCVISNKRYATLLDKDDWDRLPRKSCGFKKKHNDKVYAILAITGRSVGLHRWVMNAQTGQIVDHINGNSLDNRKVNLRFVTTQQNAMNKMPARGSQCGYKGVYVQKRRKDGTAYKYTGMIEFNKVRYRIRTFNTKEAAARWYDAKARELFGEYAWTNFPLASTGADV